MYPEENWKVLYDQLDNLLENDEALKTTVYATHDAFEVMDDFVFPHKQHEQLADATKINTNTVNKKQEDKQTKNNDKNTETNDSSNGKKNNKGRRGEKKNKGGNKSNESDEVPEKVGSTNNLDLIPENRRDQIKILSHNLTKDNIEKFSSPPKHKNGGKVGKQSPSVVVPPDMLSSCSDITDDESENSDVIDLDGVLQDVTFFKAQRVAERRAKKKAANLSKATVKLLSTGEEVTVTRGENEVKVEPKQSESGPSTSKQNNEVKVEAGVKTEGSIGRQKSDAKRQTTIERSLGDKLKDNKAGKKEEDIADIKSESVYKMMSDMDIKEEKDKSQESISSQCADVQSTVPPHCMISPYNKQVNVSASQVRAENNLKNHPMLNTFPNNPKSGNKNSNISNRNQRNGANFNRENNRNDNMNGPTRSVPSVAQVMRLANWPRFIQKTAYVVHILQCKNTRLGAGTLKPFADMNRNFALFSPNDSRIPRMKIPIALCPKDFFARKNDYAKRIYLAKITKWNEPKFALGELVRDIGNHGEITTETEAFLLQMGIDYAPFPDEVTHELPTIPKSGWSIPEEAFEGRKDLRDQCIFTIDPATARDLDDALSCETLANDRYRVGVHIADVSYFVRQNSDLDKFAADRATSVYLVDQVIPMLPRVLSEQLCSLNPNEDRLAFSVIWEMDRHGHIQKSWFGRSVIRSCTKLSYDHAQTMIDNPTKTSWLKDELPEIGGYSPDQIRNVVMNLHNLARHMRARRMKNGALRLDQKKLSFALNWETKMPEAIATTEGKSSNFLVEEFMLLANISAAHKIHEAFPEQAVLRCHPEPQSGQLEDMAAVLRTMNIEIDCSSSGGIYSSIIALAGSDEFTDDRLQVIINMMSKPMQNALYFCSGTYREDFCHYALNVPFYTHFTSPIRRYPDLMVHRLLASAADVDRYPMVDLPHDELDRRLMVSNEKKQSAKRASEYSNELYLAEFIRKCKEIVTDGIITGVLDHALDVLLLDFCTIKRAYLEKLPLDEMVYDSKNKNFPATIRTIWSADHSSQLPPLAQSYTFFTRVKVLVTPFTNDQLKFNVTLLRPEAGTENK